MRAAIILTLMAGMVSLAAEHLSNIELPKSGSVRLTSSVRQNMIHYVLSLKTSDALEITLLAHDVPLTDHPPSEWRALLACEESAEMVVALLEANEFGLVLIQYDLTSRAVKEHHIAAARLLGYMRASGGMLKVNAPNRITLVDPNQKSQSWSVTNGSLISEGGIVYEQGKTLQIGSEKSQANTQTSPLNIPPINVLTSQPPKSPGEVIPESAAEPTPTLPSKKVASSTPWSIIVVLVVGATSLLWLLKRWSGGSQRG